MVNDSSSSPELYAKSNPPVGLTTHSGRVAEVTARLLDSTVLRDRLGGTDHPHIVDIDTSELAALGHLAGELHDTGKAHPDWQAACETAIAGGQSLPFPPHSARSALYTFAVARKQGLPPLQGLAVSLSVLHHHTPMTRSRMKREQIQTSLRDGSALAEMARKITDTNLPAAQINEATRDHFLDAVENYHSLAPHEDEYRPLGTLVTLLRSAIVQADHHVSARASGHEAPLPETLDPTDIELFDTLRPFQQRVNEIDVSRLIGLAGCGEGKTHSALQWGRKVIADGRANRLVFAMPTQVTTNNLLLSLTGGQSGDGVGHVPSEEAALYHSASETFYQGDVASERWNLSDTSLNQRARRWFQRPVTVTTVDHVLSTLVNGYDWAGLARGNLVQSAVIFDELHAYDEHTTSHILGAIEALERVGVPWYVMSATIPPQIRDHRTLKDATTVESEGRLDNSTPSREPFVVDQQRQSLNIETVLKKADETDARRIMIVRNTVADARELARTLMNEEEEVVYYSSAFTQDHRERKESEIRQQFGGTYEHNSREFLVCTQVCEISLDLSADLLLTDVAPIDAIIQRAGRLHRDGVAPTVSECHSLRGEDCPQCSTLPDDHRYECIVFAPLNERERWLPYANDKHSVYWEILVQTADVLHDADRYNFDRSLKWVDDVYSGLPIEYDETEFIQASENDWLYGDERRIAPDAERGSDQLTIRNISTYKRAVFMEQYTDADGSTWTPTERWHEEHDCPQHGKCGLSRDEVTACDRDIWQFATKYAVEIPQWWLQSDDHPVEVTGHLADHEATTVVNIEYSYSLGADPNSAG